MNPQLKNKSVRLKGKAKTELRRMVHDRAGGQCEVCGKRAPLLIGGVFDVWLCGHLAHIRSVGAGGSDIPDNVLWKCSGCHLGKEHGPRWTKL